MLTQLFMSLKHFFVKINRNVATRDNVTLKPMTHLKVFFRKSLPNATFVRKLSDVAYTLVQVFTCESQLSETERVLLLKVDFRTRWAVIGQSESQPDKCDIIIMSPATMTIFNSPRMVAKTYTKEINW